MPNYLFLLHENPAAFAKVSPEEMQAIIQKYTRWKKRMQRAGVVVGGTKLQDGTGRVLRQKRGKTTVTDGPYTEGREVIGGIFEVKAKSFDAAVEAAQECPHIEYGVIEIRMVEIH